MTNDVFGNLMDWGPVIDELEALRERHELDSHQAGLIRILRYRDNWRLREAVLDCVKDMSRPSDELLQTVLAILMDEAIYDEARSMAAEALAAVCGRQQNGDGQTSAAVTPALVVEKMNDLLHRLGAPVFHKAIRSQLERLQESIPEPLKRSKSASRLTAEISR